MSTSLITDSDFYSPGLNQEGSLYVDQIPSFNGGREWKCPCNNHKFTSKANFTTHIKTNGHKRWLENLNANRINYFTELDSEKKQVREQKIMIAQFQREIAKLENEKRELLKMVHLLSDINRMPPAVATTQQQDIEDLMNFD